MSSAQSPHQKVSWVTRRGLSSLVWLLSEKVLQLSFSAISVGLIARTLGAADFGEFQYVLSILFIFSAIGLLAGSETAAPRLSACQNKSDRQELLGSLFLLRLLVGTIACISMTVWAFAVEPPQRTTLLLILALSLLVAEPFNVLRLIRETRQQTRVIALVRLATSCLKILCIYLLYLAQAPLITFVILYCAEYFVVAVSYLCLIRDDGLVWTWKTTPAWMKFFLHKGAIIWVGILSLILMQRMDRIILENRLSSEMYGHYTAAMSLLDSAWFFGPVAVAALAPSMVYRLTEPHLARPALLFVAFLSMIGLGVAFAIYLFSPLLMPLIFGADFQDSVSIIQLGAFVLAPGFGAVALDAVLIRRNRHGAVTAKWVCAVVVTASILSPWFAELSWAQGLIAIGAGYATSLIMGAWLLSR